MSAVVVQAVAEEVLVAEPVEVPVEALVEAPVAERAEVLEVELVAELALADRRVHSAANWLRATRSHHRRNPLPASARRVRTMRQELLL